MKFFAQCIFPLTVHYFRFDTLTLWHKPSWKVVCSSTPEMIATRTCTFLRNIYCFRSECFKAFSEPCVQRSVSISYPNYWTHETNPMTFCALSGNAYCTTILDWFPSFCLRHLQTNFRLKELLARLIILSQSLQEPAFLSFHVWHGRFTSVQACLFAKYLVQPRRFPWSSLLLVRLALFCNAFHKQLFNFSIIMLSYKVGDRVQLNEDVTRKIES